MEEDYKIKQYQAHRVVGKELNGKLFNALDKDTLTKCALLLDLVDDAGGFIFNEEADTDRLADIAIHDYLDQDGETGLNILAESDEYETLPEDEKIILHAKLDSAQSLFLVDYIKPEEAILGLKDVFNAYKSIEIIDFGLSEGLIPQKTYLYARIMKFEDFSCTTGNAYVFDKKKYLKVKKALSKQLKKLPTLKQRTKISVAFFHVNTLHGRKMMYQELN